MNQEAVGALRIPRAHDKAIARFALGLAEAQYVHGGVSAHPVASLLDRDTYGIPKMDLTGILMVVSRPVLHKGLQEYVYMDSSQGEGLEDLKAYVARLDQALDTRSDMVEEKAFYYRDLRWQRQMALATQIGQNPSGLLTVSWYVQDPMVSRFQERFLN